MPVLLKRTKEHRPAGTIHSQDISRHTITQIKSNSLDQHLSNEFNQPTVMKFSLLTTALLTLTPLSVLADEDPTTVVLRKCVPLWGDMSEGEVWHIQDVFCYSDVSFQSASHRFTDTDLTQCLSAGYNVGACDRVA